MKKTEAISILAASVRPREAKDRARYDEAVRMAIEALKCSETPKSSERAVEATQPDHNADISKKVSISCSHENDLISRQAAIDALTHEWDGRVTSAFDVIKSLPPAQPEIIRCKDCKHRDKYGCCKYWKGLAMADIPIATDDNDFCSYAKRI